LLVHVHSVVNPFYFSRYLGNQLVLLQ